MAERKMLISLKNGDIDNYEAVREFYAVRNANDLTRLLYSLEAKRIAGSFPLVVGDAEQQTGA